MTRMEEMINDPFGEAWREETLYNQIRLRLWSSHKVFEDTVVDMKEAVQEIQEKLKIGKDGKAQWVKDGMVKKELARVSFIFNRANYQELLARLRDGISNLESLTRSNTELEPERRRRSHGRLCKIIRRISENVFGALRSTITCSCARTHDVGLQILAPSTTAIPGDRDEEILKKLQFRLVISQQKATDSQDEGVSLAESRQWHEVVLRPAIPAEKKCFTGSTSAISKGVSFSDDKKKVRFSSTSFKSNMVYGERAGTQSVVLESTMSSLSLGMASVQSAPAYEVEPRAITDFCSHLRRSEKTGKWPIDKCCGQITDPTVKQSSTYDVYHRGSLDTKLNWPFLSLKEVLSTESHLRVRLLYKEKLRLAWLMALALLQLEGTRWISSPPTHNDIFIHRLEDGSPIRDVFLLHHFPVAPKHTSDVNRIMPDQKSAMLSLGALLIEVMLGQPIHELVAAKEGKTVLHPGELLSDEDTTRRLLDRINMQAGDGYAGAVRRCIHGSFCEDSHGEDGAQDTYARIVGLLEDDLKFSNSSGTY
ncbi:uncharacterized protein DNG_09496 [Cephalotrichum gorgonifer]|uniref:DUF7580 domain-containing protein n=1 Tax=Cephalotrichum gorgonifer TaxID=2041049 RepID=A0AAE8N5Z5_9PEZI|nr:uncharacterized protein DNG_09496 [Cephalotrichum gorgonifer]